MKFITISFVQRLKYHTQWQVRPSRNKKARGRKISGIEPMPGEEKVFNRAFCTVFRFLFSILLTFFQDSVNFPSRRALYFSFKKDPSAPYFFRPND